MKKRLLVAVLCLASFAIPIYVSGCGAFQVDGDLFGKPFTGRVAFQGLSIDPSSGTGPFKAELDYKWERASQVQHIVCFYVPPGGTPIKVKEIDPLHDFVGRFMEGEKGLLDAHETIAFDVAGPDGKRPPGQYKFRCIVSESGDKRETTFTVTAEQDTATRVVSVSVSPQSGAGKVDLSLSDEWRVAASSKVGEPIHVGYVTPEGTLVETGIYEPYSKFDWTKGAPDGWQADTASIPLDVTRADGSVEAGEYTARCWTDSSPEGASAAFTVTQDVAGNTGGPTSYQKWTGTWTVTRVEGLDQKATKVIGHPLKLTIDLTLEPDGTGEAEFAVDFIHVDFENYYLGFFSSPRTLNVKLSNGVLEFDTGFSYHVWGMKANLSGSSMSGTFQEANIDSMGNTTIEEATWTATRTS
jgi:hypothetical protein